MSKIELNLTSEASQLNKSPALDPYTQSTFHHDKGIALYYLGRNQDSLRCFDKILQQNPTDLGAHTYKVDILLRMNRYPEALTACDAILKINPNFTPALYNKTCALSSSGSNEEATNCYNKASQVSSYDDTTYFYQGKALLYLGKKSEAIEILGKAIEKNKDCADAYIHQGNAFYALGNYQGAIEMYKKIAGTQQNYFDAYYGWGKALFALGEHKEALATFNKSIELNPDSPHAYNSAGVAAAAMGDKLGATAFFSKAIKLNPVYALYYCNKGKTLNEMGKGEEALACFNKAEELSHSVKLGGGLSPGNIKYINRVLSEDRVTLIERLKHLQTVTLEAQKIIDEMMESGSGSERIAEAFKMLKKSASEATSEAINGLNTVQGGILKQKSTLILKEQLDIQRQDMQTLLELVSQLRHEQSTYCDRLSEHEIKIDEHENVLEVSGTKARAVIKASFDSLQSTSPELYAYCKTFYWTTLNLLGAYRSLSTDILQGNLLGEESLKEVIFIAGAKKLASYGATIAQGIPLLGSMLGVMDSLIDILYTATKQHQLNNKVNSINRVIQSKFGIEEDISLEVAKVALAMTYAKEQEILTYNASDNQSSSSLNRAAVWLKNVLENIKQNILSSIELHDKNSAGATLALSDVALMFVYLCKNSESIIMNNKTIEEQLASIVKHGELNKLIINISDTIFEDINLESSLDSEESITTLSKISGQNEDEGDNAHKPTQAVGEESHCCCTLS